MMIRTFTSFLGCLLLCFMSFQGVAQDDEFDATIGTDESEDKGKGRSGSFGKRLSSISNFVSINGFVTNEFHVPEGGISTFDQHYFNLFATAELNDRILAEIQLEYEHGGEEIEVRYAQLDFKLLPNSNALILRTGKFLTPAGEFNEYLYPEYLNKIINRAYVNREIVPSAWGEVGIQLRGMLFSDDSTKNVKPYYSLYVVNGLQGDSGGSIRGFRGNNRDKTDSNKAFGGNLGIEVGKHVNLSANYYTGKYAADGSLNLSIAGISGHYDNGTASIYGAYHMANQELDGGGELKKNGFYIQGGYKIGEKVEPILRYDQIDLDDPGFLEGNRQRISLGLNYHIFQNAVVKCHYDIVSDDGTNTDNNILSFQFAIGF